MAGRGYILELFEDEEEVRTVELPEMGIILLSPVRTDLLSPEQFERLIEKIKEEKLKVKVKKVL